MEDVFSPILKNVPTCENGKDAKGYGGDCEFETMVYKIVLAKKGNDDT